MQSLEWVSSRGKKVAAATTIVTWIRIALEGMFYVRNNNGISSGVLDLPPDLIKKWWYVYPTQAKEFYCIHKWKTNKVDLFIVSCVLNYHDL